MLCKITNGQAAIPAHTSLTVSATGHSHHQKTTIGLHDKAFRGPTGKKTVGDTLINDCNNLPNSLA